MYQSLTVHHEREPNPDVSVPDSHQDTFSKTMLGFWIYLMTDCVLFATLFVTYAVLHPNTFGGPSSQDIFSLPMVYVETLILLTSSVTCGLAMLQAVKSKTRQSIMLLALTFLLGASFLFIELREFTHLVQEGHSWEESAFLSSFFTLVGTHGLHITIGLIWAAVLMGQLAFCGLTVDTFRRMAVFSLYWHFLDLIWIFIFSLVYLLGVI